MSRDMVPINMRDPFMKDPFFSSTWEEFDKIKHDMMEKSKSFWGKVDKVRGCSKMTSCKEGREGVCLGVMPW